MTQPDAGWTPPAPEQQAAPAPAGQPAPQQPYAGQPQPQQPPYGGYQPAPYGAAYPPAPPMPKNDLGVLALVFGILGVIGFGFLAGIPAVILGKKSKEAVRAGLADNESLATVGLVTGWIAIGLGILGVLAVIGYVIFFAVLIGTAGVESTLYDYTY